MSSVRPAGPPEVREVGTAVNQLARRISELLTAEREGAADPLHHRDEDVQPWLQGAGIAAEVLDRVVLALRDDLDRRPQNNDGENDKQHAEDFKAAGKRAHDLRFH